MDDTEFSSPVTDLINSTVPIGTLLHTDYVAQHDLRAEHIPELMQVFARRYDQWTDREEGDAFWAGLKALKALGRLGAEEASTLLLRGLNLAHENEDEYDLEEIPRTLADIGAGVMPAVNAFVADNANQLWARAYATEYYGYLLERKPETREAIVVAVTDLLRQHEQLDPHLNASLVSELVKCKAVESAPVIEAAYAADSVDEGLIGDWVDVQLRLGLLEKRPRTPRVGKLTSRSYERKSAGRRPKKKKKKGRRR